jgi:hypothetical protein
VYAAGDENRRRVAVDVVIAADVRSLIDELLDLARIRQDTLGSRRNTPLLLIDKRRMQVRHYHIFACDAYNVYMPQHFVLACWASHSTSIRQLFADLCNEHRERHCRTNDKCSTSQ